jgi:hypothetical protein
MRSRVLIFGMPFDAVEQSRAPYIFAIATPSREDLRSEGDNEFE